jgi:hypothetical protein
MGFISALALIMLTLVGYSSGVVLASSGKKRMPAFIELIFILLLIIFLFRWRETWGEWQTIGSGVLVAGILGAIVVTIRRSDLADEAEPPLPDNFMSMNIFKQLWERWKLFAEKLGNFQSRLIMGYFYFFIVTPFALIMKFGSDPLTLKGTNSQSEWTTFDNTSRTLEESKRQY